MRRLLSPLVLALGAAVVLLLLNQLYLTNLLRAALDARPPPTENCATVSASSATADTARSAVAQGGVHWPDAMRSLAGVAGTPAGLERAITDPPRVVDPDRTPKPFSALTEYGRTRRERLLMIHMAKTGGTTFLNNIAETNPESSAILWEIPSKKSLIPQDVYTADGIFGHMPFGFHKWFGPDASKYTYITMMRNPVDRVVSHYYYHLANVADVNHEHAEKRTLLQWVNEIEYADNHMTAFLSGAAPAAWWNENDPDVGGRGLMLPKGETPNAKWVVTKEHFELAKFNLLNKIGFVGITEHFQESLVLVEFFMGWRGIVRDAIRGDNKNFNRPLLDDLPAETVDAIKLRNQYDLQLYEIGLAMYEEQVQKYGGVSKLEAAARRMRVSWAA